MGGLAPRRSLAAAVLERPSVICGGDGLVNRPSPKRSAETHCPTPLLTTYSPNVPGDALGAVAGADKALIGRFQGGLIDGAEDGCV